MGFLQDFGSFMSEVNALNEEIDNVKHEVITSLVDSATGIKQTINDTASEISNSASETHDTIKQSTTLPSRPLGDDIQDN